MNEQQSSYRQIMKATSIFGGVQVLQIIIQIIRSKFVAILLGPSGMGIVGLLTTTTGLISGLTNFGIGTSAVKSIAEAESWTNNAKTSIIVVVVRRLVWATGILGAIITILVSPLLSQFTFGNKDYSVAFIWLSATLIFNQLTSGQLVILQGLRKLQYLSKANLYGSLLGLVISIPLYFWLGIKGIVPVIITTSFLSLIISWYFSRKINIEQIKVTKQQTIINGKLILQLGFMLSLSGLYGLAKDYGIRLYISNIGGVEEVGLYTAGLTIINSYVGMIFTAMGTDYFPRLSAISNDNNSCKKLINQQSLIAALILSPIISFFLVFINWVIILLFSQKFTNIESMMQWIAIGLFFKAISWAMAFLILAKGKSKLFLVNELFGGTITLLCNLIGYYLGGLSGMGVGFLVGYFLYMFQVYFIINRYFDFSFDSNLIKIVLIQIIVNVLILLTVFFIEKTLAYFITIPLIGVSTYFSIRELDRILNLKELFQIYILKNNGRK